MENKSLLGLSQINIEEQPESLSPIKRIGFVKIEYWDCGEKDHHHLTEQVARKCMKKATKRRRAEIIPETARRARYIVVAKAIVEGATLKEAGAHIGVCGPRAGQMFHRVRRVSLHPKLEPGEIPGDWDTSMRGIRKYKDYWLDRVAKVAELWGVTSVL
jgi:hypothetical protein